MNFSNQMSVINMCGECLGLKNEKQKKETIVAKKRRMANAC
jgi:hypothetical protein